MKRNLRKLPALLLLLAAAFTFIACAGGATGRSSLAGRGNFELTILHTNDHHSHLDSTTYDLPLAYDPSREDNLVRLQMGGMSYIHSLLTELRGPNSLFLSSGELNGTLYYSMFGRGTADFEVYNVLMPDAYMPGNHEFDEGDGNFARLIKMAQFPILSGNIVPTPQSPLYGVLGGVPYIIKEIGGREIAIIGVVKVEKTQRSSMVSEYVDFIEEFEFVETQVKAVQARGIDIIIVLSHMGYDFDIELAEKISDIDIIVGGDTHNLLDSTGEMAKMNLPVSGEYPTIVKDPKGRDVLIVQAWEYALGFGVLKVIFGPSGDVIAYSGQTILPVGEPYLVRNAQNQWLPADRTTHSMIASVIVRSPVLTRGQNSRAIDAIVDPMREEIDRTLMARIGTVSQTLPFDRIPTPFAAGQTPNGSFAAQIVADAFLRYAPTADIAIQNAGGIRAPLMQGDFTMADALTILPFSNTIAIITIPGSEVVAVLDEAIRYSQGITQSTGAFPYSSHLRYDVLLNAPEGVRSAYNVEVRNRSTGVWSPIDMNRDYTVVTNSFTVLGRDNYLAFERAINKDPGVVIDLNVNYAVPLIDYIQYLDAQGRPIAFDRENYSIKSVR